MIMQMMADEVQKEEDKTRLTRLNHSKHCKVNDFIKGSLFGTEKPNSGWVVTWFLLGYTVRMFEYTVRTF